MTNNTDHPQRLTPTAAPGVLSKRLHALSTRIRLRDTTERDPVYLALVRQCQCVACGLDKADEAAHLRMSSAAHGKRGAMAKKPADRWAAPLCAQCHREGPDAQHKIGEQEFWHRAGINPLLFCVRLYAAKGSLDRMRAVTANAIAEAEAARQSVRSFD